MAYVEGKRYMKTILTMTYCMMHISVQFSAGRSFVGFRIRYYVSKLFLPIGENTKEFVRNVPRD